MSLAYSIADAAKAAGIGRTTVYSLIRTGKLPARKLGARTVILADDLEALIRSLPTINTEVRYADRH